MRVLYDHQVFSLQSYGGITRVFSEIIRYLNHQPNVSASVLLGYSNTEVDFHELVPTPGLVFHPGRALFRRRIPNYALNEMLTMLYAPFWGKFDIYHSTHYRFIPAVRAVRRVATLHDCMYERFPALFPEQHRIRRARRRLFAQADLILCVSDASRNDLFRFYDVPSEKAVVVHNGISPMERAPHGEPELRKHILGDFLLYVGARPAYKNFIGLLRAYAQSGVAADYSLLVIGGGPSSSQEEGIIQQLGISGRVMFLPFASTALLAEAYAQATLFVYPSLGEGFGMPPLEAASVGCASLVACTPATREVCRDAVFYFDPESQTDFSRMLGAALSDGQGRSQRVARARLLLEAYTWEDCGRKTLEAYRRLL